MCVSPFDFNAFCKSMSDEQIKMGGVVVTPTMNMITCRE